MRCMLFEKELHGSRGRVTLRNRDGVSVTYAPSLVMDTEIAPKGCVRYAVNRDISLGIVQNREGPDGSDRRDGGEMTITRIQFWQ